MRDLNKIMKNLNEKYFNFADFDLPEIKWYDSVIRRKQRGIIFASYDYDKNVIEVNTLMNKKFITMNTLKYIVYHEMLHFQDDKMTHKKYKSYQGKNRMVQIWHDKDFRQREHLYPQAKELDSKLDVIAEDIGKGKNYIFAL